MKKKWLFIITLLTFFGLNQSIAQTDKPIIYASTNVWGSVAKAVGGDEIALIIGIDANNQDPHGFEATAKNKLDLSKANIVLYNGGGYDDWVEQLIHSLKQKPVILSATEISNYPYKEDGFNEHLFYDITTVKKVAQALNQHLQTLSPNQSAYFQNNTAQFEKNLDTLIQNTQEKIAGKSLKTIATEPVIEYLLQTLEIKDLTPITFIQQSETDAGPSVKTLQETLTLINNHEIDFLTLNGQTEDTVSDKLQEAAKNSKISIIYVYETLPENVDNYIDFIKSPLTQIEKVILNGK